MPKKRLQSINNLHYAIEQHRSDKETNAFFSLAIFQATRQDGPYVLLKQPLSAADIEAANMRRTGWVEANEPEFTIG